APDNGDGYAATRRAVDHLLDGRKQIRDFSPAPGDWSRRNDRFKSALDPALESVILHHSPALCRQLRLSEGEHLDTISLIKRVETPRRFVSTARVALDPLIRRLSAERPDDLARLRELAGSLEHSPVVESLAGEPGRTEHWAHYADFAWDTQLFYGPPERDEAALLEDDERRRAAEFTNTVRESCRSLGIGEPPPYYAILAADGDGMGQLIGGMASPEEHIGLSNALADFAHEVEAIVTRHHGAPVYRGGDDVLAFLPLDSVLACADALRGRFRDTMPETAGQEATLSVGVAIVHYHEPLNEALAWARAAERAAKRHGPREKNGLAVALYTRSGGGAPTTVVQNWDETPAGPVADYWHPWIDAHREDALPDGAAYELRRLADGFAGVAAHLADPTALLQDETRRILTGKRAGHGQHGLRGEQIAQIIGRIARRRHAGAEELRRIADEIIIARRLARARDIAAGRPSRPAAAGAR
ncbi:MAG TPA: type III-B CRISPR-associated protein Cas10/Cmr2, partial [Thermomicrobiales bacterium]|nr:type III-B CRISPR-associated protein Cas10/Cmr2 [Thermomicrobiales bacterium]